MYILKGFVTIQDFISNDPGVVSSVGEISTWSMTYTKSPSEYILSSIPGYRLISMLSKDTSTGMIPVPANIVNDVLSVVRSIVAYAQTHFMPYTLSDFRNTIIANYKVQLSQFKMGSLVNYGEIAIPEYIEWVSSTLVGGKIRIWLADKAFADQYDEYEIEVIPPVTQLDDLFANPATVYKALAEWPIDALIKKAQVVKDSNPETLTRILSYPYIFTDIDTPPMTVHWPVLIYGKAGDNIDSMKEAVNQYVLTHSTHSHDQWAIRSPELFKRTEFMILPRWDKYSIPDLAVETGLHSSLAEPFEVVNFAQRELTFYPGDWIPAHLTLVPYFYKSLMLVVVDGPDNLATKERFSALFPDYLPISTTSLDFNRMQKNTRDWLLKLHEMILICETIDEYTVVPEHYRKLHRDNKLYLAYLYQGVNYLVAAKSNYR